MKKVFLIVAFISLFSIPLTAQLPSSKKSKEIVRIDGDKYYLHYVEQGETLSSVSRAYGISVADITEDNPVVAEGLKAGQVIRIKATDAPAKKLSRRQFQRTFDEHTVAAGETTYSIARRYLISIQTLIEDNPGLDPSHINAGQKLLIRRSQAGDTSPEEIKNEIGTISATLNKLSEDYYYHVVEMGETLYSLSRKWNIPESVIKENNDLSGGLRAGALLKIPVRGREDLKHSTTEEQPLFVAEERPIVRPPSGYYRRSLNIAMLLPMWNNGVRTNFVEFYQGALLALEDLKAEGHSIDFNLFDTERSQEKVSQIIRSGYLDNAGLVIGPVYEEEIYPVYEFVSRKGIPLISPLSSLSGRYNEFVYQLPPSQETKYDKMRELFTPDKNIVFITTEENDSEFEQEMLGLVGSLPYQRIVYSKGTPAEYIDSLIVNRFRENLLVVTSGNELGVDQVLAAVSSVQNNRKARSISTGPIQVIGNSRWLRYPVVDKNLFFKLNVTFVTSYHSDRSSEAVNNFDKRYIAAFGDVPSLFSYRGYDALKMFAGALFMDNPGSGFPSDVNRSGRPLQTKYVFRRGQGGYYVNTNWSLVTYRSNYTIGVK